MTGVKMIGDHLEKLGITHYLAPLTTLITLISTIVYITWFAASIEKRVSLVEQHSSEIQTRLEQSSIQENDQSNRFQDAVNIQLARLDDKIDKIYGILVETKRNQSA